MSLPGNLRSGATWWRILVLVVFLGGMVCAWPAPNVVLLVADDLGYGELGCQGNPQIPTPHIDSLARHGIRFTQGYVTASYCSPSRAGLLTGRYQTRFGHELNPVGHENLVPEAGLPLQERTLADLLREAGLATALIGKWHLGGHETRHPLRRGFDRFFGFLHEGHFYVPQPYRGVTSFLRTNDLPDDAGGRLRRGSTIWATHLPYNEPSYDAHNPILDGTRPVTETNYFTDAITREAVAFIEDQSNRPFFLCVAYSAVHSPMQGADVYMKRFDYIDDIQRRVFAAMLSNMDDSVGAILDTLRQMKVEEDTLVVFLSDNGGPTRELTSSNAPLRGGKGTLYEGGIRVPFLLQWKRRLPHGLVYDRPVLATDILATVAAAVGIDFPSDRTMDGVDLLPFLSGQKKGDPHDLLFWRMGQKTALREGDWKIVRHRGSESFELYHLGRDLGEEDDLASLDPKRLKMLRQRWKALNGEMIPPVWSRQR